jgi:hypothetical protein
VGESLLFRNTGPEISTAALIFDASLEVMFNILFDFYYSTYSVEIEHVAEKNKKRYYTNIITILRKIKEINPNPATIINFNEILRFHEMRNAIQHRGFNQSYPQISDYCELTKTTLKEISEKILEIDWQSISLGSLIKEEKIQKFYMHAEDYYYNNKFKEAALCLVLSFETAKSMQKIDIAGSGISLNRFFSVESKDKNIEKICSYIEKIDEEIEIIKLGLNYKEFRRYDDFAQINVLEHFNLIPEEINDEILRELTKKHEFNLTDNHELIKVWCDFAMDFVIRSVIQWETHQRIIPVLKNLSLFNPEHK